MSSHYVTIGQDISAAVQIVTAGRVVAVPTGTSYGLAADATQGYALQRVRNLKQRLAEQTFTVFMAAALWSDFLQLTVAEQQLLEALVDQPVTLLVKPQASLAHLAQDGLVGLRVIDHPLMQALAKTAGKPLTATSANLSGQKAAYSPAEVQQYFPGRLDDTTYDLSLGYIMDGGQLPQKPATTIAQIVDGQIKIVRPGELAIKQLQAYLTTPGVGGSK